MGEDDGFEHFDVRRECGHEESDLGNFVGAHHWLVVFALGAAWAIDGLEVTLKGAVAGVLQDKRTLGLSAEEIGALASFYLLGAVLGALACGYLTDRYGRTRLFFATLSIYLGGTLATAFTWDYTSLAACRIITGIGIGGEYAAINSAIDELIPARWRGHTNLAIDGSWWLGNSGRRIHGARYSALYS